MAHLTDLANELLCKIFSYLGHHDLVRISQLSRRVNATANPFLYHSPSPTCRTLRKLLRTILIRPMLGHYVRSVSFEWSNHEPSTVDSILQASADAFGLKYPLELEGAQLTLLLHVLPRLERLALVSDRPDAFDDFLDKHAFRPTATLPVGLQSVRKISWFRYDFDGSDDYDAGLSPHSLQTMLLLPSIHKLFIRAIERWDTVDLQRLDQLERTSKVTNLKFYDGEAHSLLVARILKIPMALERFTFGRNGSGRTMSFNAPEVGKSLGMHRETLKFLEVWVATDEVNFPLEGFTFDGVIGSLREWPVLVELRCTMTLLLGTDVNGAVSRLVEVLPVGIQVFEIFSDCFWLEEEIADEVEHMLQMKEAYGLHPLKVLRVSGGFSEFRDRLKAPCEAAGVYLACR